MQALLASRARLSKATLVDLPAVERLALRYLDAATPPDVDVDLETYHSAKTGAAWSEPIDVLVSNYAFSELTAAAQDEYLEAIVARSRRGYLTINPFNGHCVWPLTAILDRLRRLGKRVFVANEAPLSWRHESGPKNVILLWGHDSDDERRIEKFAAAAANDTLSTFVAVDGHAEDVPTCQLYWPPAESGGGPSLSGR